MSESGLVPEPKQHEASVAEFVKDNSDYYSRQFEKIQGKTGFVFSWTA